MEYKHFTMKELPATERPYEKCEKHGTGSLTEAELLAVVIRTGHKGEHSLEVAQRVIRKCSGKHGCDGILGLNYLTLQELMEVKGIGRVKAIQLLCAAELSKRMMRATKNYGPSFTNPELVAEHYMEDVRHLEREQVLLMMLDGKSRKIKETVISTGTVNSAVAAPREVYYQALKHGAVYIILLHNHPSGDPTPSKEDLLVTSKMKETGSMIGIPLIDHIILGDNQYVSLRERGLL
jgi:DNA repair protein RadC